MKSNRLLKFLALMALIIFLSNGEWPLQFLSMVDAAEDNPSGNKAIAIDVDLVNVPLSALDKKGAPIKDLRLDEIKIFEDNEPPTDHEFLTRPRCSSCDCPAY